MFKICDIKITLNSYDSKSINAVFHYYNIKIFKLSHLIRLAI